MPSSPANPTSVNTGSVLTFQALLDEVMGQGQSARFPQSRLPSARRWLSTAYTDVWNAADWTFKKVFDVALDTVDDGNDPNYMPTMPTDFQSVLSLYDDNGDELVEMTRDELQDQYRADRVAGVTGRPEAFAVSARQIMLAPSPDQSYSFTMDYVRRICHRDSGGLIVVGFFDDSATDHYPLWDDHHYLLVPRAQTIGLKTLNDPTWPPLQDEYQGLLGSMLVDYTNYGRGRQL